MYVCMYVCIHVHTLPDMGSKQFIKRRLKISLTLALKVNLNLKCIGVLVALKVNLKLKCIGVLVALKVNLKLKCIGVLVTGTRSAVATTVSGKAKMGKLRERERIKRKRERERE